VPSGRKPDGDAALSNAERQARHQVPVARTHRAADRRSRPRRWQDAVAVALQAVYAAWLEALPDTLQGTATADALQVIVDLDLDTLAAIELPRGYGSD
jgi:hypothetical protein